MKFPLLYPLSASLTLAIAAGLLPAYMPAQIDQDTAPSLTTLRSNNTSAANTFPGAFNDLPKPGHISPLPMSTLLPTGEKTRYISHLMPWFRATCDKPSGCPHVNAGYESDDTSQIFRQLTNMRNRGFSIVFIDWYGEQPAHAREDDVVQKVMHEAERLKSEGVDFTFAIMADKGISGLKCGTDENCNTQLLLSALLYAYKTYEQSPAYFRLNGRPVVPFFWPDTLYPVNWDEIRAKVPGNPLFVFQSSPGFTHPDSGGAFSWNGTKDNSDIGLAYFGNFYQAAAIVNRSQYIVIGSAYAGMDDRPAPWGKNKIILRRCGLTWLDTMRASLKYQQLTGAPLPYLQVMTWNDYEEGTAIEMGIDNCVADIPATVNNGHLTWTVAFSTDSHGFTGSEDTIAYYRILDNPTGEKLQELKRVPAGGQHDVDLAPFNLQSGQKLYIEAVGKSQILNHLSQAVSVP